MTQQVFIFIFALIMMAFVLMFGVRQVILVNDTGEKIATLSFVEDFKKEVQTYANFDVGSNKLVKLSVPSGVNQICFFNSNKPVRDISDPVLNALLRGDKKNNLFVLPLEKFQNPGPGFFIDHLTVEGQQNPVCVLTANDFQVYIETIVVDNKIAVNVKERL
ncbi:MAG: hypothetical protein Q8L34_01730 [Candidatus Woesearchaeota archaeon]|nr:hypothetical protein [Candidatus Woesearchaeota archaeon]